MSIQDLIQTINTQLPDNNQQLITEAILRGVLENMVNTLSSELRVFNINSSQVTDNGDGTYTLASVENELMGALAFDEDLNIYQYNGTHWTLKTSGATAAQGAKADSAVQPTDTDVSGNDWVLDEDDMVSDSDTKVPTQQSVKAYVDTKPITIPEYTTDTDADNDSGLAANAPYAITGERGVKVKNGGLERPFYQQLTDAPTISWDVSQGEIAKLTLGGNRTLANPTNLKVGRYDLIVEQDGVGNRSLYLDTNYRMPDGEFVLSSDAGSQDKVSFISDGTLMYGAINKGYRYVPQGFVMTVDTSQTGTSTNTQFTIPTTGSGYNYSVKNANTGAAYLTGQTGNATVDFGSPGVYDIEISGDFPQIFFNNGGDKNKLIEIKQWGNIEWVSFVRAFWGCSNLIQVTSADVPNLSGVSTISAIFQICTSLIHVNRIEDWDVSGVSNFSLIFQVTQFNQDISGWDVSSAENMFRMLQGTPFDQDISNWDIGNLTNADFFMVGVTLSTVNYDAILNGWAAQTVQPNLSINFGFSKYSAAGQVGRDILINTHGWTITDGGPV